ncbi:MAG: GAP family protein [Mycobacterium sp.]
MWIPLLVMAVAVSFEPFRLGMTVLMLNRPRPVLQLFAFLSGGFLMGTAVGLVVLFVLREKVLGTSHFTLPRVQIVIGAVALVIAAVLVTNIRIPVPAGSPDGIPERIRRLASGRSLWFAGAAGMGIALPSVDYLAALALILASGASRVTQVGALLTFNAVACVLVEVPLIAYVLAPERTRELMGALHNWVQSHRRRNVALVLAVVGCVLLTVGIASI